MSLTFASWIVVDRSRAPRTVVIEVSTRCNLSCRHCFRRFSRLEERLMDSATLREVIDQCVSLGVERVVFTGWGEPTTHPRLLDAVQELKERGVEVAINTNGTTLESVADELVELGVDEVIVSLEAFDPGRYEEIRGVSMDRVVGGLEALKAFREARSSRRPRIVTHFVVTRSNVDELRSFPDFAKRFAVSKLVVSHLVPLTASMERELACFSDPACVERLERVLEEISKYMFSHYFEVYTPSSRPRIERRCPYAWASATFVGVDGYISPCIFYAHDTRYSFDSIERTIKRITFGHISDGLENVWRSKDYVEFRARAALSLMPSCLDCKLAHYCEPTLSNERDCWGNTPTCSHCPFSHGLAVCPL